MSAPSNTAASRVEERLQNTRLVQGDGAPPEVLFGDRGEGENGVALLHARFRGGAFVSGTEAYHGLVLQLEARSRISWRVGDTRLEQIARAGNITLCPAGVDVVAESDTDIQMLLLVVPNEPLALKAVELGRPGARLAETLSGHDGELVAIARDLLDDARLGFSRRGGYHRELSATLFNHIFERYAAHDPAPSRSMLSTGTLSRIHQYAIAHIAEPIEVDTLADVAGHTRSHFPRLFRRTVALSPHQYLVRLRLKEAERLLRGGRQTLAEVAVMTGFNDQSHLTNWVRRVYGTTPRRIATDGAAIDRP